MQVESIQPASLCNIKDMVFTEEERFIAESVISDIDSIETEFRTGLPPQFMIFFLKIMKVRLSFSFFSSTTNFVFRISYCGKLAAWN